MSQPKQSIEISDADWASLGGPVEKIDLVVVYPADDPPGVDVSLTSDGSGQIEVDGDQHELVERPAKPDVLIVNVEPHHRDDILDQF